jgi:hypothetical protein
MEFSKPGAILSSGGAAKSGEGLCILNDKGLITTAEIDKRVAEQTAPAIPAHPGVPTSLSSYARKVEGVIYHGTPHDPPIDLFKVGNAVRAANISPPSYTPAELRRRAGSGRSRSTTVLTAIMSRVPTAAARSASARIVIEPRAVIRGLSRYGLVK